MAVSSRDGMETIEEREELVVSATCVAIPNLRIAHFLKPTVASIKALDLKLPFISPKSNWPLQVSFHGWKDPQRIWAEWVDLMQSKHQELWEKAGIFKAIMFSRYRFHRNDELIFGVAERWCCETNTFVFPWGEATITLEDMMILGGFSVFGGPFFSPAEGKESEKTVDRFKKLHEKLPTHLEWLNFFMDSGNEKEHEAFLSLWLSRFVFPSDESDKIGEHNFPIAVNLSRGTRIALAPAVLACVYKDLGLLKESMAASAQLEAESPEESFLALALWAPLQLVQLWVWERFPVFRPEPNFLNFGDIRAARWDKVKRSDIGNVRPIIDSCGDIFLWRPYTLTVDEWSFPKFYKKEEEWVQMGRFWDEELESFARCLRACVLIGVDHCVEPYQPHRVAMQFGFDQDLPAVISRFVQSLEAAWINYSKPLRNDSRLYIPTRLFESDLSAQYSKWWNHTVLVLSYPFPGVLRRRRTPRILSSKLPVARLQNSTKVQIKVEANDLDVPPGFSPKRKLDSVMKSEACSKNQLKENGNYGDVPPGFSPKRKLNSIVNSETCSKNQLKGNGNGVDVPLGLSSNRKVESNVKPEPETCSEDQLKGNGNDGDVPPGFSPKRKLTGFLGRKDHCPVIRPETSAKIKEEFIQTDHPIGFPLKNNNGSQIMRPESFMEKEIKEDLDFNFHPAFTQEIIRASKQNCTPGEPMPTFGWWSETVTGKPSSASQTQGAKCSSTTTGMGASESVQNPRRQSTGGTINNGNVGYPNQANERRNSNLTDHIFTSMNGNENGGRHNCSFEFGTEIIGNMRACLKLKTKMKIKQEGRERKG